MAQTQTFTADVQQVFCGIVNFIVHTTVYICTHCISPKSHHHDCL